MKKAKKDIIPLKESIEEVTQTKEELLKAIKNSKDVKEGKLTEDEAKGEPESIVYLHIVDTIIKILQDEKLVNLFKLLEKQGISTEAITTLINIISLVSANSSYNAILFYDELLKRELGKQFDNLGNFVNIIKSDVNGIKAACEVYNKKIGNIENTLKINEIKEEKKI